MFIDDSTDRVTAGKIDVIARNARIRGRRPLIYSHSAVTDAREIKGYGLSNAVNIAKSLVDGGQYDLVAPTAALSFGHAGLPAGSPLGLSGQGELERAITYHRNNLGGSNEPVIGVGVSMGTMNWLVYTFQHPGEVAALILFSPVWDIPGYYAANTQGNRAAIGTAWNKTYPTALPAEADIHALTLADSPDVPMYLVDSSDDPYTVAYNLSKYNTWRSAWGSGLIERQALGAVGHGNGTIGAADLNAINTWLESVV